MLCRAILFETVKEELIDLGLQQVSFLVGGGKDTYRNASIVVVLIEEILLSVLPWRNDQQIEVIKDILLLLLPVLVVEVVFYPHEPLIDYLRDNGFLQIWRELWWKLHL